MRTRTEHAQWLPCCESSTLTGNKLRRTGVKEGHRAASFPLAIRARKLLLPWQPLKCQDVGLATTAVTQFTLCAWTGTPRYILINNQQHQISFDIWAIIPPHQISSLLINLLSTCVRARAFFLLFWNSWTKVSWSSYLKWSFFPLAVTSIAGAYNIYVRISVLIQQTRR